MENNNRSINQLPDRNHGNATHGQSKTSLYFTWKNMKYRCSNPNYSCYEMYGGRGIKVCERWQNSFENFKADMGERFAGYTLDRIDNDKDYSPENCRWATHREQSNNTRRNRHFLYRGEQKTIRELCYISGLTYSTLSQRLKRGWSLTKAMRTPYGTR